MLSTREITKYLKDGKEGMKAEQIGLYSRADRLMTCSIRQGSALHMESDRRLDMAKEL